MTAPVRLTIRPPDGRSALGFCWGVSSYFGWGLYGMNLALALSARPDFAPVAALPFQQDDCVLDPLRMERIAGLTRASTPLWDALPAVAGDHAELDLPLLVALGQKLRAGNIVDGKTLLGQPNIGVVFLESPTLDADARRSADQYALIVAGSSWNEHVLRANGIVATTTVLQGVDTSLFHPAPRGSLYRDRFVIFSGGKLEYRKGQDLVVRAFRIFRERHPEAVLMTAWSTAWHWRDDNFARLTGTVPAQQAPDGFIDSAGWAVANGVPPNSLIALGRTPNIAMPHVLREADVAIFPNRCEGGTNLVAMECMASGIPVILSANTGHLDLLAGGDVALPLTRQTPVAWPDGDTEGWGESDVEEMIAHLETVWRDRDAARQTGLRAAAFMASMTWERQTELLLRAIAPLLP